MLCTHHSSLSKWYNEFWWSTSFAQSIKRSAISFVKSVIKNLTPQIWRTRIKLNVNYRSDCNQVFSVMNNVNTLMARLLKSLRNSLQTISAWVQVKRSEGIKTLMLRSSPKIIFKRSQRTFNENGWKCLSCMS